MSNVNENVPAWQFNTIPGNANQGAVLMTRSDIGNPPFNQSDFVWKAMEDIIGTANVKLEYSEPENKYRLYKAKGHRDEEGEWSYEWTKIGEFDALTPETVEILRVLKYVEYVYDADTPNVLKVVGVKKDGTSEVILNISYTTVNDLNEAVTNLTNSINAETNRATIKENQLEDEITQNTPLSGTATQVTQETNGKSTNVKVDNDNIKVNNNNELTTDVIDDTQTRNDKGWSSSKISQIIHQIGIYKGQVATVADLPSGAVNGDIYKVLADGNYYMWNGTTWDDLESDYTSGPGIDITNRVIRVKPNGRSIDVTNNGIAVITSRGIATDENGVYANLNQGLELHNNAIRTKLGQGMMFDANDALKVKVDGTTVVFDANGNLKATGSAAAFNIGNGLKYDSSTNILSANIGTGLSFNSSGELYVTNLNRPVKYDLLCIYEFPLNTNEDTNINIYNGDLYNLFYLEALVKDIPSNKYTSISGMHFVKPDNSGIINYTRTAYKRMLNNIPQGLMICSLIFENFTYPGSNLNVGRVSSWAVQDAWPGNATNWSAYGTDSNTEIGFRVYGLKV